MLSSLQMHHQFKSFFLNPPPFFNVKVLHCIVAAFFFQGRFEFWLIK